MRLIVLVSLPGGSGVLGGPIQGGLGGRGWVGCCIHRVGRASPRDQMLLRGPGNKHLYFLCCNLYTNTGACDLSPETALVFQQSHIRHICNFYHQEEVLSTLVVGGDNWGEKHEKLHRSTLFGQLLPQTEKP